MKLSFFIFLVSFFCLTFAEAAPSAQLSTQVQRFLIESTQHKAWAKSSRITVFIQYKEIPFSTLGELKKIQRQNEVLVTRSLSARANTRSLWIARGTLAELSAAEIRQIAANPRVEAIRTLSRRAHLVPARSSFALPLNADYTYGLEKIGVPVLRSSNPNLDGRGVRVGILDTGADGTHPSLAGKIIYFKDFISNQNSAAYDDEGHGTHVAGTIAGSTVSNEEVGVAPGAQLVIGKVFDKAGNSTDQGLLEGMQWMADPDGSGSSSGAPLIVSNSWTVDDDAPKNGVPSQDPMCIATDTWRKLGIIPVFAAGNDGPEASTVDIPAACPSALAVAATDDQDRIADFSSRGPANWQSGNLNKPDIAAPGVDVDSLAPGGGTAMKSGTSMATPHVVGSLALLLQGRSRQDEEKAIQALLQGADVLTSDSPSFDFGAGRVNLVKSLQLMNSSVH